MKKLCVFFMFLAFCVSGGAGRAWATTWTVGLTSPTAGSTVTANPPGSFALTFSEKMSTSTAPTVTLTPNGGSAATLSCVWNSGDTILTCSEPNFVQGGAATIALTNYVSLKGSNGTDSDSTSGTYSWSYTQGAPQWTATMTTPVAGSNNSTVPTQIALKFYEASTTTLIGMNTTTPALTSSSITVTDQNGVTYPVTGPVWGTSGAVANSVATWTITSTLPQLSAYTVTFTSPANLADAYGGMMATSGLTTWNFATDNTAVPTMSYAISKQATGTSYVATQTPSISLTFNEIMNTSTTTNPTSYFTVKQGSTAVAGTYAWNYAGNKWTWTPSTSLTNGSTYTLTVSASISDLAGVALATGISGYNFTIDVTAPVVASVSPTSGSTNIGTASSVLVNFTEATSGMNQSTFTASNITITDNSTGLAVPYTQAFNTTTNQLTLTPAGGLPFSTSYTVSLANTSGTGIADNAGNLLNCSSGLFSGTCSWSFTTQTESASSYVAYPSFMCSSVKPNVLIILGNSNSFDEDLNNNAIGSPTCSTNGNLNTCSKSVLARLALIQMIQTYSNKMNIGLMSYAQTQASSWYLANNFYFASFDPRSWCPNPSAATLAACQSYCNTEEPKTGTAPHGYVMSANESACYTGCSAGNALFQSNYRDPITTTAGYGSQAGSAEGSAERSNYCTLVYPKQYSYTDTSNNVIVYHEMPGTFYNSTNPGNMYVNQYSYNTGQYPTLSSYTEYTNHTASASGGNSDSASYFQNSVASNQAFGPTDEDESEGFLNFGQRNYWYYTSPAWFVNTSPGGGFLNVQATANNSSNTQQNLLLGYLGYPGLTTGFTASTPVAGFQGDAADYMKCSAATGGSGPNACPFIVNAGWTATAGALLTAQKYFMGTLPKGSGTTPQTGTPALNGSNFASPIQYPCQNNYIVYVTDGDASVDPSGNGNSAVNLMPGVLSAINGLLCPSNPTAANCQTTYNGANVNIPTYILGMGLTASAQANVNSMAVAAGTAVNGQAYQGNTASAFNSSLSTIFNNIMVSTASGTAASILNNTAGSGSNILQAMFYPSKLFSNNTTAYWIGEMQNLWYYIDPALNSPSIREDTNHDNILELNTDNILQYSYSPSQGKTLVGVYTDSNGTNTPSAMPIATETPDYVNTLWSAGLTLWSRNLTSDPRTIYTGLNSVSGSTPQLFCSVPPPSSSTCSFVSSPTAWSFLQIPAGTNAYQQAKATTLINYISGTDQLPDSDGTQYRARSVTWQGLTGSGCGLSDSEGCTREWKLGDIVTSTPKLVSNQPLNFYNLAAPSGYSDTSYAAFIASSTYQNRGMVFVGANDGMLHAFKLGTLVEDNGQYVKAQINDPATGQVATASTKLGREEWAYIPQNVLPYLTYYASVNYDHIFYVDRPSTVVDASIGTPTACTGDYSGCTKSSDGSTWRTVLIGGMGFGGAARTASQSCNSVVNGMPNCTESPITNGGVSSYFALDITNPETPKFLWEFNDSLAGDLGASTTGPIVVRESYRNAAGALVPNTNGKWYAIFASGPTGPINTANHEFLGQSDQNLKIFVVDLATGVLLKTFDTGLTNAFAGSLSTASIDTDRWNPVANGYYSDDVIYVGYTQLNQTTGTWTNGGVLRLTTSDMIDPTSINATTGKPNWNVSTLISGTGPVTTTVTRLQDVANNNLWIYFGTGRFYFNGDDPSTTQEKIYAVKEPCYSTGNVSICGVTPTAGGTVNHMDGTCSASVTTSTPLCPNIVDQTGTATTAPNATIAGNAAGWSVNLGAAATNSMTERVISDPTASPNGAVFFTSFVPNSSPCTFGGSSYLWALGYNSGAQPPASVLQGQALIQVSSGALQQLSLSSAFSSTNLSYNGRRSSTPMAGAPPVTQGLSLIRRPAPVQKILHFMEK